MIRYRYGTIASALLLATTAGDAAFAALAPGDNFAFYLVESLTYDDNLFRLPDGLGNIEQLIGEGGRRSDYVNRVSAGVDARWDVGLQAFNLKLMADDNRFRENDDFDYVSGNGRLSWRWQLGSNLSGEIGSDYNRALTSFATNRSQSRDLLETQNYFADLSYRLGPHWAIKAGARRSETTHSDDVRRGDNFESNTGSAGVEYRTSNDNTFTLDYRTVNAEFPRSTPFTADRDYQEDAGNFRWKYQLGSKTLFDGSVGYLSRTYSDPLSESREFSGDVWHAAVEWAPTVKTQLRIAAYRELRAYVDAESDYFVAKGASIGPTWAPTQRLAFSLTLAREDQDYIGTSVLGLVSAGRRDNVTSGQAAAQYQFSQWLAFSLSYRAEQRDSNRPLLEYDDQLANASIQLTF